jgi:ABC-2 type transport system ATP-binding protein
VSIIAGLRRPDAGEVLVDGVDAVADPRAARRRLGLAPQETGIYPTVSVRENLTFFGELADVRGPDLVRRIDEVAAALELTDLLDRQPRALSGGEKRRVHTAMAMLHRPPLLLLDEPTTGVDVLTRARLLEAVQRLATEDGTAVCYSTHYLPEVEGLGASVAIIDRGRMIARGSVAGLVAEHADAVLELTFAGDAPALDVAAPTEALGSVLRIHTGDPAAFLPVVINRLGDSTSRLRGVEILRPSLESVFLSLTGRRYDDSAATPDLAPAVVAEAAPLRVEGAI